MIEWIEIHYNFAWRICEGIEIHHRLPSRMNERIEVQWAVIEVGFVYRRNK